MSEILKPDPLYIDGDHWRCSDETDDPALKGGLRMVGYPNGCFSPYEIDQLIEWLQKAQKWINDKEPTG